MKCWQNTWSEHTACQCYYGSETWSLSSSDKYKLNVSWNICLRSICNGFWRESVKPLLFYCKTMPLISIADQRRLTFLRSITCSTNPILSTLGRLCDYDCRAPTAAYNINTVFMLVTATVSLLCGVVLQNVYSFV